MNKKLLSIQLITMLVLSSTLILGTVSADEIDDTQRFIGTWEFVEAINYSEGKLLQTIYHFYNNGECHFYTPDNLGSINNPFWHCLNGELIFTYHLKYEENHLTYSFSDNDETLMLTLVNTNSSIILSKVHPDLNDVQKLTGIWQCTEAPHDPGYEDELLFKFNACPEWEDAVAYLYYDPGDYVHSRFNGMAYWIDDTGQLEFGETYPDDNRNYLVDFFLSNNDQTLTIVYLDDYMKYVMTKLKGQHDETQEITGSWKLDYSPQLPPGYDDDLTLIFNYTGGWTGQFFWFDEDSTWSGEWYWTCGTIALNPSDQFDQMNDANYILSDDDKTLTLFLYDFQYMLVCSKIPDQSSSISLRVFYDQLQNTLTINEVAPGNYYSDSIYQSGANLMLKWSVGGDYSTEEYVLSDFTIGSTGELSAREIHEGDTISGFAYGYYDIIWKSTGETISSFHVYNLEEDFPLIIVLEEEQLDPGVAEGTSFTISVKEIDPITLSEVASENATVVFNYQTRNTISREDGFDSIYYGQVALTAPEVTTTQELPITVSKSGHKSTTRYVFIRSVDPSVYGRVYGHVVLRSESGDVMPARHALINTEVIKTFPDYMVDTFTDEYGEYALLLEAGNRYNIIARYKTYAGDLGDYFSIEEINGAMVYSSGVKVEAYDNIQVNITIDIPELRLEIEQAITEGTMGGEIFIVNNESSNMFQNTAFNYQSVHIVPREITWNRVSLLVSGDDINSGKTIAITVETGIFDVNANLMITYDGEQILMADNIQDIMNPNDDGFHAEYLITIGTEGTQILISIPHFSEHTITISSVVEAIGGITAVILYIVIIGIVAAVYVVPIWVYRRK